jgi:cyclophilin family peptidyl-prolyl cis-trans isomerase
MRTWLGGALAAVAALAAAGSAGAECPAANPEGRRRAEITTVLGRICLDLFDRPGEAPLTVGNFVTYARRGAYDGSFLHRLIPDFVLQGGGYRYDPATRYTSVPRDPAVPNEPGISNVRGTVAMAKVAGQASSATSEWFINLVDNTGLDAQNGGFTVFARVVPEDLDVVDAIGALRTEYGPLAIDAPPLDPVVGALTNLPVLSLLPRDPDGYGCLKVNPDPLPNGTPTGDDSQCETQAEFLEAVELTIAALDPEVPERLVTVTRVVPEPAAPLLLAVGALVLGRVRRRRAREARWGADPSLSGARSPRLPSRAS